MFLASVCVPCTVLFVVNRKPPVILHILLLQLVQLLELLLPWICSAVVAAAAAAATRLLVECNKLAVDIDNEIIVVHNFVRDKYRLKFPELESLVRCEAVWLSNCCCCHCCCCRWLRMETCCRACCHSLACKFTL
jgi:hypothetical protein